MYRVKLEIPNKHTFTLTSSRSEQRKGRDTDIYEYEEKNIDGDILAKYIIRDSMSIYPPQSTVVSFVKLDPLGKEISSGNL